MRNFAVAAGAALLALAALMAGPAFAQQRQDDFAAACMKRGVRESACVCQAKLARGQLDAAERRAAIAAMTGGQPAMQREVARMSEAKAKAFAAKMQRLGQQAKAQCA
ncbi:MAG: hypothetical protein Q8M31_04335 [Beijerinckiaceae bacterium]|nr:hypothetical protein [Beijerinckiaceae bacterium]